MRLVGLHLRLATTLQNLAQQALNLGLPIFQCFCIMQTRNTLYRPSAQDIADFLALRPLFNDLYLHGSYWINLARDQSNVLRIVNREISFAKKHQFTHMVLHPGSAVQGTKKMDAIDIVARMLNTICKNEKDLYFVLENTTHAHTSVGSNIDDYAQLLQKIEYPERIGFCIDTAHAHEYGYVLTSITAVEQFVALLDRTIGLQKIMLLHINDTKQQCGSRIDHHVMLGEGEIGLTCLKAFALHDGLKNIPIILELPSSVSDEQQGEMVKLVRDW